MDDSDVHPVDLKQVLGQPAYLLFYQRKDLVAVTEKKIVSAVTEKQMLPIELSKKERRRLKKLKRAKEGKNDLIQAPKYSDDLMSSMAKGSHSSKIIEFIPSSSDAPYDTTEPKNTTSVVVNSTSNWKARPAVLNRAKHTIVNSTTSFQKTALRKLQAMVNEVENDDPTKHMSKTTKEVTNVVMNDKCEQIISNGHFKILIQDQQSRVIPWNHMATSDSVYERNKLQANLDSEKKRKRPTRDDMEYDAPQLKELKKRNRKKLI